MSQKNFPEREKTENEWQQGCWWILHDYLLRGHIKSRLSSRRMKEEVTDQHVHPSDLGSTIATGDYIYGNIFLLKVGGGPKGDPTIVVLTYNHIGSGDRKIKVQHSEFKAQKARTKDKGEEEQLGYSG